MIVLTPRAAVLQTLEPAEEEGALPVVPEFVFPSCVVAGLLEIPRKDVQNLESTRLPSPPGDFIL